MVLSIIWTVVLMVILCMHEDIHQIIVIVMTGSKKVCQVQTSASFDEAEQRANVSEDTENGQKEDQSALSEGADENQVNSCIYYNQNLVWMCFWCSRAVRTEETVFFLATMLSTLVHAMQGTFVP